MRKIFVQSIAAFIIGAGVYLAGDRLNLYPDFLIPAGVVLMISGVTAFILGLIIREPAETKPGEP
jgi:uncharacterized membrane protein YjjP (DUF1212 family)